MGKKIIIDPELCIGCGSCEAIAEEYFRLDTDTGKAKVVKDYDEKDQAIIKEVMDTCPAGAISIKEEKEE